jgi:hypothetical protein
MKDDICWTQTALTISPMTLRTLNNNKSKLPVLPSNVDVIGIRTTTADDEISLDSMESLPDDIQEVNCSIQSLESVSNSLYCSFF